MRCRRALVNKTLNIIHALNQAHGITITQQLFQLLSVNQRCIIHFYPPHRVAHQVKHIQLRGVRAKAFLLPVEILFADFKSYKGQPGIVGRNPAATAAEVCVKHFLSLLGVPLKNPVIQGNGLLCRVDSLLIQGLVSLHDVPLRNALSL